MEELKVVRDRGYAFDNEECMVGLACIAVPLCSFQTPVAAMSVTFPRFRYAEGSHDEKKLIDQVVSYGRMLNALLS